MGKFFEKLIKILTNMLIFWKWVNTLKMGQILKMGLHFENGLKFWKWVKIYKWVKILKNGLKFGKIGQNFEN